MSLGDTVWDISGLVAENQRLVAENDRLREALERIEHWPWNVTTSAEADLRLIKEFAQRALTGEGDR